MSGALSGATGDWLEAAIVAHQRGALEEAEAAYARVLAVEPANARALRLRGILARERGDLEQSRRLLGEAAAAAPHDPEPLSELALTELAAGGLAAGERQLRAALVRAPGNLKALANLGAVLLYRGHVREAITVHQQLLEQRPDDLEALSNLAQAFVEAGDGEAALAALDDALDFAPGHPQLLAARGGVLCALGEFAEALPALEQALAIEPRDDIALANLGYALAGLGRHDSAAGALRRALAANPDNARAAADLVNLLHRLGDSAGAMSLGERFLARHPGERLVLATLALLWRDLGREQEAAAVLDLDGLVFVTDIPVVEGFADLAEFNATLGGLIVSAPQLDEPLSKATRGGSQTGELDLAGQPALQAFAGLVAAAVDSATPALRRHAGAAHDLARHVDRPWGLRAWATLLASGGHQTPHMHPQSWLSGVYYVSVPEEIGAGGDEAGYIEFGAPPERYFTQQPPVTRRIEPREGRLVLFPSYLYHRTLPFDATSVRISLAFDVVPSGGG